MLKLNPYVAQLKRAETAAAAVSAGKKRKLSPTNTKNPGKKAKTVKQAARFCKDRKLENKARFVETLRGISLSLSPLSFSLLSLFLSLSSLPLSLSLAPARLRFV
jgi:hypothetical protein